MGWKDLQARVRKLFGGTANSSSRRPDGGTSCYRPIQRRNRQEESLAREKAAEYAAGQPQTPYAHTGFTGMNPPMTGRVPVQSTLTGEPGGFGAPRQGNQTGYARPGQFPPTEPAYSSAGPDNIAYMPGVAMAETGNSFTHVEHIMAITSLQSCYEAIECMKNGETLIVTLDVLGSESESIRCQDMLAGAAFTLQCTVRTLNGPGVVVIAPAGVKILPEQQSPRRYEEPEGYVPEVQPGPMGEYAPRRERRVSRNAVGWDAAAQTGPQGINPYTGSMPAAAGAYGAYGGYL